MARGNFLQRLGQRIGNLLGIGRQASEEIQSPPPVAPAPPPAREPEPIIPIPTIPSPSDIFPDIFGGYEGKGKPEIASDEGYPIGDSGEARDYLSAAVDDFLDGGYIDDMDELDVSIIAEFDNPSPGAGGTVTRTIYAHFSGEEARNFLENPSYGAAISYWVNNPNPVASTYNATLAASLSAGDWLSRMQSVSDIQLS